MRKSILEFIGTFVLVFIGTGAIILNEQTLGGVTHFGVSMAFGVAVFAMIFAFGKISGAHINPAVTIAMFMNGKIKLQESVSYIISQLSGAIVASIFLALIFNSSGNLGATLPSGTALESFYLEIILTYLLVQVIFVLINKGATNMSIAIIVGFVVFLEAFIAGPITGASMNPARSVGPALVSGNMSSLSVYIYAPIIGGGIAAIVNLLSTYIKLKKDKKQLSGSY